jgi:hypothetical protein
MKTFFRITLTAILTSILVIIIFFVVYSFLKTEKPGFVVVCVFTVLTLAFIANKHPETKLYFPPVIYLPIFILLLFAYKGEGMKFYIISIFTCTLITYAGSFFGAWLNSKKKIVSSGPSKYAVQIAVASLIVFLIIYLGERNAKLDKPLMAALDSIIKSDQESRTINSFDGKVWSKKQRENDSVNMIKVADILRRYGWPGEEIIGWPGSSAIWAVIQHSTLENQEKYLPLMREAVKNGNARLAQLAMLEDRILVGHGKEQIYGTQAGTDSLGIYKLYPIKDERNVNKRRFSAGLGPLQWYAKQIGLRYTFPKSIKKDI